MENKLECAVMHAPACTREIAMIDRKGYVYCAPCGERRRASGTAPAVPRAENSRPPRSTICATVA